MTRGLRERIRNRLALMDRRSAVPAWLDAAVASITFDDFPSSAYEIGGKILEASGLRATYFVSGCYMGRTVESVPYFQAAHLREIHAKGHEIGCHTYDHVKLGEAGARYAVETCKRNAKFVADTIGADVEMTSFAYPNGDASVPVKAALAKRFPLCRGVRQAQNAGSVDLAQLNIVSLEIRHAGQTDLAGIIAAAKAQKSWLVFLSHDVAESPSPYGSTPAMIEDVVARLKAAAVPVLPLKAIAASQRMARNRVDLRPDLGFA